MEPRPAPPAAVARPSRLQSRESVLAFTIAALVIAFVVTGFMARLYHKSRQNLAQSWYQRGMAEMNAGRAQVAVPDFEAALIYGRENVPEPQQRAYELSLAEALSTAGGSSPASRSKARSYLLDLWQESPGNGQINLQLARLSATGGDDDGARQYYEDAIAGTWQGDAQLIAGSRNQARQEYAQYLTSRGDNAQAQAVLLEITPERQPASRRRSGRDSQ